VSSVILNKVKDNTHTHTHNWLETKETIALAKIKKRSALTLLAGCQKLRKGSRSAKILLPKVSLRRPPERPNLTCGDPKK